jgi:hypothetical protein
MRKLISGLVIALSGLVAATPVGANQPALHFTEDVTGDVITCEDASYTAVSGELSIVIHEGASQSGNINFTGTIVPRDVILVDEAENTFSIVGAEWFGGTFNAQQGTFQFTDTDHFNIIGAGGVFGTVRVTFHLSPNGKVVDLDFGTCQLPEEE